MTDDSITLIGRYVVSYNEYFTTLRNDRILAMAVNPLLATPGCQDMLALMGHIKGQAFISKAKYLLENIIRKFTQGMEEEVATTTKPTTEESSYEDTDDDDLNPEERLAKSRLSPKTKKPRHSSSLSARIHAAVEKFFSQTFDPEDILREQYARMNKDCSTVNWEKVKENETLYISSLFDSIEWWEFNRKEHWLVFLVVPSVLACPSSNGLQERIFSACTWFDNPLRQRLHNKRFEMSVILAVNESLLKCKVPSDDEAKQIVERVIAKFNNSIDFDAELDLGLDPDAEDFVSKE